MAPQTKVSKEEIIETAYELARDEGIDAVTAKAIAKRLGCSIQPVYWVFDTMENLRSAVTVRANEEYNKYSLAEVPGLPKFKAVGWNYIRFAKNCPNLFKLLFMSERYKDTSALVAPIDDNRDYMITAVKENYGITDDAVANRIYVELWLFSHGLATMIVTKTVNISDREIGEMLTDVMMGVLKNYKSK